MNKIAKQNQEIKIYEQCLLDLYDSEIKNDFEISSLFGIDNME